MALTMRTREEINKYEHTETINAKRVTLVNSSGTSVSTKLNVHTNNMELLVNMEGHVCAENTTSTPLGIGAVFTGAWQDSIDFNTITVGITSDKDSATDGLEIQWSALGVDVDDKDVFSILANQGKVFTFSPARRYFRVKYTNGSVAQTVFNLQSMLKRGGFKASSHRIKDSIVADDDAELVKAVITGLGDDGIFRNVGISTSNRLKVVSQPYTYAVAEGEVLNHSPLLKFGTRSNVAAGVESIVWEGTSATYTYLTSAEQLKVTSTSAADSAAGTGIRTLKLIGLDANFDELEETITMNGLTAVTTTASFIRIFRAFGVTSGTSLTNVGTISVTNNAGTNQLAVINAGDGQTLMSIWTVPRNKMLFVTQGTFSTDSNKGARVSLFVRQIDGGILYPWQIKYRAFAFSGNEVFPFQIPFKITGKTDIEVRVLTPASAGVTEVGATFEGWYE